jgi:FkbM family methyltransferase
MARVLVRAGIDVVPVGSLRHPLERRRRLLEGLQVDLVIDVGANTGQYGSELRGIGYRGEVLSFEPLLEPFTILSHRAQTDARWSAIQSAIGPSPGRADLHVAANGGASSSFLPMLEEVVLNAPGATYIGTESVVIRRLDEASREAIRWANATFLKADVQGYELEVLDSATEIMPSIVGLQLEMSLVPLYEGAPSFIAMLEHARDLGFGLVGLEPGFAATDGRLLQVDGLFVRTGQRT